MSESLLPKSKDEEILELKEIILWLTDRLDALEAIILGDDLEVADAPDGTEFDNPDLEDWSVWRTETDEDTSW